MTTDWIIAAGTLVLAIVAVIAIFQDRIRVWLMRPGLDVSIDVAPPDCHKAIMKATDSRGQVICEAACYYFRLRVKNSGNQRAEMVEVFAAELLKQQADGSFKKMDSFLPMNLLWSHINEPFLGISPEMEKLFNLGHILDPTERVSFGMEDDPRLGFPADQTIFSFDVERPSYTMSHLIPPGTYRVVLLIGAANARPVRRTVEIVLTGNWCDHEETMLGEGIGIRML